MRAISAVAELFVILLNSWFAQCVLDWVLVGF